MHPDRDSSIQIGQRRRMRVCTSFGEAQFRVLLTKYRQSNPDAGTHTHTRAGRKSLSNGILRETHWWCLREALNPPLLVLDVTRMQRRVTHSYTPLYRDDIRLNCANFASVCVLDSAILSPIRPLFWWISGSIVPRSRSSLMKNAAISQRKNTLSHGSNAAQASGVGPGNSCVCWEFSIYLLYQKCYCHASRRDLQCVQLLEADEENGISGQHRFLFGVEARAE